MIIQSKQKQIDMAGRTILQYKLNGSYIEILPIDGNTEDIDGEIRLLDGKGNYLNKFLIQRHLRRESKKTQLFHFAYG